MDKLEPKHEKEARKLMNSYKNLYSKWVFELRYVTYSIDIIIIFLLSAFYYVWIMMS